MTTDADPTIEVEATVELDAERRERIARLQARRSATTDAAPATGTRRRRRHPAKNSRIAATAIGVSAMFALVTAYGVAAQVAGPELAEVAPPTPARVEPIVIEIRLVGPDGTPIILADSTPVVGRPVEASDSASAVPAAAVPAVRVLTAPAAPASAAPVVEASTNGSR